MCKYEVSIFRQRDPGSSELVREPVRRSPQYAAFRSAGSTRPLLCLKSFSTIARRFPASSATSAATLRRFCRYSRGQRLSEERIALKQLLLQLSNGRSFAYEALIAFYDFGCLCKRIPRALGMLRVETFATRGYTIKGRPHARTIKAGGISSTDSQRNIKTETLPSPGR
jgi:hypothetical protein